MSYTYILQRSGLAMVTFFLATTITFFIMNVIPGDIAYQILGDFSTPEALALLREQLGTDQPIPVRYVQWFGSLIQGDLGDSMLGAENITGEIIDRLPVTGELAVLSVLISVSIGLPTGIMLALRPDSPFDWIVRPLTIVGLALPSFWIGLLVLLTPSTLWSYAPPRWVPLLEDPLTNLQLMLPAAAILGTALMASVSRISRTSMMEVLREDYVRTARAKGVTEYTVVVRHALRNALIPVATLTTLQFASLLGGTVIIESIFTLPGLGTMAIAAINLRDFAVVQGFVVFMVLVYVTVNMLMDIMVSFLDPRVRLA